MLTNSFTQLVGLPPIGFEFMPYLFSCLVLFITIIIIISSLVVIFRGWK